MGYPIAANLCRIFDVFVWNRSMQKAEKHALEYGSNIVTNFKSCNDFDYVLTCLPSSIQVTEVLTAVHPHVSPDTVFVDLTSGDLASSQKLAKKLQPNRYMDAPVSGGPSGASQGSLTSMVGTEGPLSDRDRQVIGAYSANIVECGSIGHGNAVKAANNFLNVTQLLLASDVLLQLKKAGVSTQAALSAINASSGRSRQTELHIPTQVMTRQFDYGFKLNLMRKDVLQSEYILRECMFYESVSSLLQPHALNDSDYTTLVTHIEAKNKTQLP